MSAYEMILVETHGKVGLVRLNRPKALNALNATLIRELIAALDAFDHDPAIGAMVITGDERAFAAGADIKEMVEATPVQLLGRDFVSPLDRLVQLRKPVIAAVSGYCLGGGNELAMTCDMIVASETARFGQPEINLGIIPGAGGTQRLVRAVGKAIAMEMVLNNRTLSAAEAERFSLVNRVVPVERYLEEALALAAQIAERAPSLCAWRGRRSIIRLNLSFRKGSPMSGGPFSCSFPARIKKKVCRPSSRSVPPPGKGSEHDHFSRFRERFPPPGDRAYTPSHRPCLPVCFRRGAWWGRCRSRSAAGQLQYCGDAHFHFYAHDHPRSWPAR